MPGTDPRDAYPSGDELIAVAFFDYAYGASGGAS